MPRSVIAAKLSPPRLAPDHLHRERLDRLWGTLEGRRVLLVVAGAGFGKTSFLADRVGRETRPVGWYTLDESDSDPNVFLAHLASAVSGAIGWHDTEAPGSDVNAIVQLLYAAERPPLLIFDDLHTVRPGSRTFGHLSRVLRYLPDGASVVLASREPPAVERARWEVRGEIGEILSSDLAFDAAEIEALLSRRFPGSRIEADTIARIAEQTEGWAAGLELLVQRIDDPDPAAIERVLDVMSSVGAGWFGYFAEEVVSRLEPELQGFLRRTCFLPRLVPEICDQVLGEEGSALRLEELHTRNLFTFGTHEEEPVYRYHPLFRSYLRRTATQSVSSKEIRSIRRKCARALLAGGYVAEAAAELIEIGDRKSALQLLRRRAAELLDRGRLEGLRPTLERFTSAELESSPEALALLGTSWDYEGEWDRAASFYRRALR
ncbi:MAG: hypothetical protein R3E97_24605, partial [Candidatus Eisenbacteria bacterium]